jgi:hypothetical protein
MDKNLCNKFCDITICADRSVFNYDKLNDLRSDPHYLAGLTHALVFTLQWLPSGKLFYMPPKIDINTGRLMAGTGHHKRLKRWEVLFYCVVAEKENYRTHFTAYLDYTKQSGWSIELCYDHHDLNRIDATCRQRHPIGSIPLSPLLDKKLYNELDGDKILEELGVVASDPDGDGPIWYHSHGLGYSFCLDIAN